MNISNAIFEISKPNIQKESYQLIKNHNQENFKKGEMLYQKYKDSFKINSQCVRLKNNSKKQNQVYP